MTNSITNTLKIVGTEEHIKEVFNYIKAEKVTSKGEPYGIGTMDFNKIVPMPKTVYKGELGQKERAKHGINNWHDWSVENWDTKWNAYNMSSDDITDNTICFSTVWNGVPDLMCKLSGMFPEVTIFYAYCDTNDFGYNVGEYEFKNSKILEVNIPEDRSKESYELAFTISKSTPEDNFLIYSEEESTYIYHETE